MRGGVRSTVETGHLLHAHTWDAKRKRHMSRSPTDTATTPRARRVRLELHNSSSRVDLVWPHAVKWHNVARLIRRAKKSDPSFRIVGTPIPVPSRAPGTLDSTTLPPAKKRRLRTKTSEAASASAASPTSPPLSPAAAAFSAAPLPAVARSLPAALLNLKWWSLHRLCQTGKGLCEGDGGRNAKWQVSWDTPLGRGMSGTVYAGRASGTQCHVAIKTREMLSKDLAGMELSWCAAVANHPDIVTILDVELCPRGLTIS